MRLAAVAASEELVCSDDVAVQGDARDAARVETNASTSSLDMTGPASACYKPLHVDDSEADIPAFEGLSGFGPRLDEYSSRDLRVDGSASPTIRNTYRVAGAFALVLCGCAGLLFVVSSLREAAGNPKNVESKGTVDLVVQDGHGVCGQFEGHLHPDGKKCCGAMCIAGGVDYCGIKDCWKVGSDVGQSVRNCCGNSTGLSVCANGHIAPCMLPPPTTSTTPAPAARAANTSLRHAVVQATAKPAPTPAAATVPPTPPTTTAPSFLPSTSSASTPCREPSITCGETYFGITDSDREVCCDRQCGAHCGRKDCADGMGGEAMCCTDYIKKNSVYCSVAGISPCRMEPLCPPWSNELVEGK